MPRRLRFEWHGWATASACFALPAPEVSVDESLERAWRLLRATSRPKLGGRRVDPDPELPLVSGDVVTL